MVEDDKLAADGILLGLPLIQNLGILTKTMLEKHCDNRDGADCSNIQRNLSGGATGKVGRLMIARINRLLGDEPKNIGSNDD